MDWRMGTRQPPGSRQPLQLQEPSGAVTLCQYTPTPTHKNTTLYFHHRVSWFWLIWVDLQLFSDLSKSSALFLTKWSMWLPLGLVVG